MLSEMLEISPGQVQSFFWDGSPEIWSRLTWPEGLERIDARLVLHHCEQLPGHEAIIHDVLQTLATVAHGLWPHWYGMEDHFTVGAGVEASVLNRYQALALQKQAAGLSLPWLKAVLRRQQQGQLPLLPGFSKAVQYAQLVRAIHPHGLLLVLVLADPDPPEGHLQALAQVLPWIATQTQARVALCLPATLAESVPLEKVLYAARSLGVTADLLEASVPQDEFLHQIFPVRGKPHPFSPGEQRLAHYLAADAELKDLFHFNQTITTRHQQTYIVDLLWPQARLVVEVDGYRYHGNAYGFVQDRERDYELLISDYVVLRLPHDAVMQDTELAVEKIRAVVHFRRQQLGLDARRG